jgi:hypothetical protein
MLPRPDRAHDQLLRNELVAGIGGLVVGHILWLVAISLAVATTTVNAWVLVVAALSVLLGVAAGLFGLCHYRRKSYVWTAFLWCLPVSPVVFSLAVLGVTYL